MSRPVRAEILYPYEAARRYYAIQHSEARRLGYPRMASFAKDIANGTLAPAPTPEDPETEHVGRYIRDLKEIEQQKLADYYNTGGKTIGWRARFRFGITPQKYTRDIDRILIGLGGYLKACVANGFYR